MAKKFTLFVVILTVLALCVVLTACGGGTDDTTPKADSTTTQPSNNDNTTTPADDTTKAPDTPATPDTTDEPDEPLLPNEQLVEDLMMTAPWITPHMEYRYEVKNEKPVFYVTTKAEGGHFTVVPEDDPDYPGANGIQLTKGLYALVRDEADEDTKDYTKYECTSYETAQWYEIWFGIDFVPEDGHSYDIVWVIETGEKGATYPSTVHYIWNMGTYWTYTAPKVPESDFLPEEEFKALTANRTELMEHETTTIGADGQVRFSFKSDNQPFSKGEFEGVSYTIMGELYINGEKYEIVPDSYTPEQWYIINFKIAGDFIPEDGKTYELVFTVNANDGGAGYCNDQDGYFVSVTVNYTAPAV